MKIEIGSLTVMAATFFWAWGAAPAQAQIVQSISITCTATGQLCTPIYSTPISITVQGSLTVQFTASQFHCSSVAVHIGLDGTEKSSSSFLPAGQSTGPLSLGTVSVGSHTITVQAEGQTGGCNVGNIGGWSGTLTITLPTGPTLRGSLAHFVSQAGWQEDIVLVDTSMNTTSTQLKFFGEDGSPMSVPLANLHTGTAGAAATLSTDLTSKSMLPLTSGGLITAPLLTGSTLLYGDQNVDGYAIFRFTPSGQEAVVPLETRNAGSYILAFDNTNNISTGIAVSNISAQAATVQVVIRNDAGTQIGTGSFALAGNGHTSFLLATQFPSTANIRGTLEIVTPLSGQLSAVGIRFTPPGTLTTIPVLTDASVSSGSMAHFASGAGWRTIIVLVNTNTFTAQAHLRFFADNGNPAILPLNFPQTAGSSVPASTLDRSLTGKQVLVVESSGLVTDPTQTGSVQFTTDGNVNGFVIFRYEPNGQEAVVPMENRASASTYTIAFDNTSGVATGIAVNNASGAAATIPVVIRDESGAQLFSGTVSLPANGHTSFVLSTQYAVTADKRGTIEFTKPVGVQIGVVGIRAQPVLTFTTLPSIGK